MRVNSDILNLTEPNYTWSIRRVTECHSVCVHGVCVCVPGVCVCVSQCQCLWGGGGGGGGGGGE